MAATTFLEKKHSAYVTTANYVASESPAATDHVKRMAVVKQMAQGGGSIDWFVTTDFVQGQSYDDSTPQATMETRLSALLTNLVALGFGG